MAKIMHLESQLLQHHADCFLQSNFIIYGHNYNGYSLHN